MKSFLIILSFVFFGYSFGQSYNTALGGKFGYPTWAAFNVKHFFGGSPHAIDASIGAGFNYVWLQGMYHHNYQIGSISGFEWFWGVGIDLGIWVNGYRYYHPHKDKYYGGAWGGIDAVGGVEYTFEKIPLNLAVEAGPTVRLFPYVRPGFNSAISVRYAFK